MHLVDEVIEHGAKPTEPWPDPAIITARDRIVKDVEALLVEGWDNDHVRTMLWSFLMSHRTGDPIEHVDAWIRRHAPAVQHLRRLMSRYQEAK